MGSRNPLEQNGARPEDTVTRWQQAEPERLEPEAARKTKLRPHESKRSARFVGITFPGPEWKDYITRKATELGDMRPSDLVVYCLSYAFEALESGDLPRPDASGVRVHHRAGEGLDLPWRP